MCRHSLSLYKRECPAPLDTIMSEKGKLSTLQLVALAMLAISAVVSSSSAILSDRQVIKREIFIQKLAARMDGQTR
jgi:hypothetical protein